MTDATIRQTLSSAVGTLDHVIAQLSRAEHGEARDVVARARVDLKTASSELLLLRARLAPTSTPATVPLERIAGSLRAEH